MKKEYTYINTRGSTTSRRLVALAVGATLFFAGSPASAEDVRSDEVEDPQEVEIDGRTYGPEDGLVVESGSMVLEGHDRASETSEAVALQGLTQVNRGSSYVSTDHPNPAWYTGRARAMANIYSGNRVVGAGFVYRRGGNDVIGWQYSSATVGSSCNWSAGPEKKKTAFDDPNPNAPVTTWHYSFSMIDPRVC